MSIAENIALLRRNLPPHVRLVCVSKFQSNEAILEAYQAGERIFGESRVQELQQKYHELPNDIEWHFIGHLQTNKVKNLVPLVSLVHGVDSVRLASEINRHARECHKTVACLLQVHIAREESKFGFSPEELIQTFENSVWNQFSHLKVRGLMGMATLTDQVEIIQSEMQSLKKLYDVIQQRYDIQPLNEWNILSMGMSDDYQVAIEEGSNMIRIGSLIFGQRS